MWNKDVFDAIMTTFSEVRPCCYIIRKDVVERFGPIEFIVIVLSSNRIILGKHDRAYRLPIVRSATMPQNDTEVASRSSALDHAAGSVSEAAHEVLQSSALPKRKGRRAPSARADPRASDSQKESGQTSGRVEGVHAVHGLPLAAGVDPKPAVGKDLVGGAVVAQDAKLEVGGLDSSMGLGE